MRPNHRAAALFVLSVTITVGGLVSCAAGVGPTGALRPVVLEPGPIAPFIEGEATRLYRVAEVAFVAGRFDMALDTAGYVVDFYPSTQASGMSLWLTARAHQRAGRNGEARQASARYARALAPDDPRRGDVQLLEALMVSGEGDATAALRNLLTLPPGVAEEVRWAGLDLVRELLPRLDRAQLGAALQATGPEQPLAPPVRSAHAGRLFDAGDLRGSVAQLMLLPDDAQPSVVEEALFLLREALPRLATDELTAILDAQDGDRPLVTPVVLEQARRVLDAGRAREAVERLLRLSSDLPDDVIQEALVIQRQAAPRLEREALGEILQVTPLGQPLAAPVMVAYARALRLGGERTRAREFARAALSAGARGPDREAAEILLNEDDPGAPGEPVEAAPPRRAGPMVRIGALLPVSGPPTLQRWAELIEEGMRAAIEGPGASSNVELVVVDDGGDPALAAIGMRSLEDATVLGVVGPLEDHVLEAASGARRRVLPIISPTALGSTGEGGVFSLGGADPGAAHALAEYAAGSDLRYVVVIHPDEPGARFEAQVFREAFEELRGSVLRILTYPPGATYFEEQLRQAEALSPQALVLPVPPRDIEALAPQVSFFGLDTLGIKILGTAGWADENVLRNVSPRHTSGVVLATPQQPGPDAPGYRRFVDAYEARFQRSLRDDIPALGYDAASLILLAVNLGASSPGDVQRALERIQNFEGATGVLSVRNGHVIRAHNLVCIQDRALVEVRTGEATLHYRPMREGDRDLGEPERVPAGPLEIYCPGMAPPGLRVPVG